MLDVIQHYDTIVAEMEKLGAKNSQMFGMPTLKLEGRAFCGLFDQIAMVFKLTGKDHAAALKISGAKLFDPSEAGHPMKEWVQVPATHSAKWQRFARAAFQYIAKQRKKK